MVRQDDVVSVDDDDVHFELIDFPWKYFESGNESFPFQILGTVGNFGISKDGGDVAIYGDSIGDEVGVIRLRGYDSWSGFLAGPSSGGYGDMKDEVGILIPSKCLGNWKNGKYGFLKL